MAARPHSLPPPDDEEVERLLRTVALRVVRLFRKQGKLDNVTCDGVLDTLRAQATQRLADSSCYSFQSVNFSTRYLRHYDYRIHLDVDDASAAFTQDATFCAQPGNAGVGVSWQSYNFPSRYLRHYSQEAWVASNGGTLAADATSSWAQDTGWVTIAPWAPQSERRSAPPPRLGHDDLRSTGSSSRMVRA